jgi:metal-responsive CopG/Arc/MetJ family transcriptional regulator
MGRVNVFLKDELLDEINEEVKDEGTSRSALIQEALEEYLHTKKKQREEEARRKEMKNASERMDRLAKKLGRWDAQAIIRKFRDTNLKGNK